MDLFVARQPIFDRGGELRGFELLYRGGAQSVAAEGKSKRQMSVDVIIQSLLEFGLTDLTRGHPAYMNFSREMLVGRAFELLNRRAVVVELLEDVEVDSEVVSACKALVKAGYELALDDYEPGGTHERLLDLASVVKLDVLDRSIEDIAAVAEELKGRKVRLLAERVETIEVRDACRKMGFELFQGYLFSKPELVASRGASVQESNILHLMTLLGDDTTSELRVANAFRRDPALSYKLLRMVNAAAFGIQGIHSILQAVQLLGRNALQRWLAMLLASSLATQGGAGGELVHAALVRARLCERLGEERGLPNPDALFIVGLFSMIDALLGHSTEELVEKVNLAEEVRHALLNRSGPYAAWLHLVEWYEAGEWQPASQLALNLGVEPGDLPELYVESLKWARERIAAGE